MAPPWGRMAHVLPLSIKAGVIAISVANLDGPLNVLSWKDYGILVFAPTFRSDVALGTSSCTLNWHRGVVIRKRLLRFLRRAERTHPTTIAMAQADSDISRDQRPKRRPTS